MVFIDTLAAIPAPAIYTATPKPLPMKLAVHLLRLPSLVLACYIGVASAQQTTPSPGIYVRKGGGGDLVVQAGGKFHIQTVGANGHTCELEGTITNGRARMANSACAVDFTPAGQRVGVDTATAEACRDFCGMRAWFGGDYLRPTPGCTDKAIAASRRNFKRAYDAKDYRLALTTLAPVLQDCDEVLTGVTKGWLRNDLALAQLRSGDAAACRQTLAPLAEEAGKTDQELREAYPPTDADVVLPMLKAARTNLRLCS